MVFGDVTNTLTGGVARVNDWVLGGGPRADGLKSFAYRIGCPTILYTFSRLFLGFLISYRNGFIVLSTAFSMHSIKHTS